MPRRNQAVVTTDGKKKSLTFIGTSFLVYDQVFAYAAVNNKAIAVTTTKRRQRANTRGIPHKLKYPSPKGPTQKQMFQIKGMGSVAVVRTIIIPSIFSTMGKTT
jgi:hypothetical protein